MPQKITLALNNLLDNAVKFTQRREHHLARLDAGRESGGHRDRYRHRPHRRKFARDLFEKFYQAEPLLTRKVGGAGWDCWW